MGPAAADAHTSLQAAVRDTDWYVSVNAYRILKALEAQPAGDP
jgi:hypothetical protein